MLVVLWKSNYNIILIASHVDVVQVAGFSKNELTKNIPTQMPQTHKLCLNPGQYCLRMVDFCVFEFRRRKFVLDLSMAKNTKKFKSIVSFNLASPFFPSSFILFLYFNAKPKPKPTFKMEIHPLYVSPF